MEKQNHVLKTFVPLSKELVVESCKGCKIKTRDHGILTDLEAGCWAAVLGHGRPEIAEVMATQAVDLFHTHQYFDTPYPGMLTQGIMEEANLDGDYSGTYLSSGSEAVSLSITLAELVTGRRKKLCFAISYLSTSPELRMPRSQETWLDLDVAECMACSKDCSQCKKVRDIEFGEFAAFVFEPGNAGGLVMPPPQQLITFLVTQMRAAGGLIVANEVTTGFGRTGKWFGFQHYDALTKTGQGPELLAMGKGLGNGYPISGVLIKSEYAPSVVRSNFRYVQSHINDPLGCKVALQVVETMKLNRYVERGSEIGEKLRAGLEQLRQREGGRKIKEIRGRGLMNVVVLNSEVKSLDVFERLLEKGYFAGFNEPQNLIRFYPAMSIAWADLESLLIALEQVLQSE